MNESKLKTGENPGRAWTWGKAFKDGKLYCFESRRVVVARPWPDPRAWVKTAHRPWRPTCRVPDQVIMASLFPPGAAARPLDPASPDLVLTDWEERLNWSIQREHEALGSFFDAIPDELRIMVLAFPERRWHLLNLLARCPGSLDLCRAYPALAFALSCNRAFHRPGVLRPYRAARSLLPKSQRDIQAWLGFAPSEQVRRILAKIHPSALTVRRFLALRNRLHDPAILKLLSHLPVLHEGILHVVTIPRYRALLNPAFLAGLANLPAEKPWKTILAQPLWDMEDCLRMLEQPFALPACRSLDALHGHHQILAAGMGNVRISYYPPSLPPPPFPGIAGLEPITTAAELLQESIEMEHCVVSHLVRVQAGQEAIYRVTDPVRATLSVLRFEGGWHPGQIFGRRNQVVPVDQRQRLFDHLMGSSLRE